MASTDLQKTIEGIVDAPTNGQGHPALITTPDSDYVPSNVLVGNSPAIRDLYKFISMVAGIEATVLITGETGTGKEIIANLIHKGDYRRKGKFVRVNCAAIPSELLESEFFGYKIGAFTGANRDKPGRFQQAHGGTIFLDEIRELRLGLQSKMLEVLENDKRVTPLGGINTENLDVRVIAATNANLREAVYKGEFRSDLYYRLNVLSVHVPPLRERKQDIKLLVKHFIKKYQGMLNQGMYGLPNKVTIEVTPEALAKLNGYDWPGNVRELENLVRGALVHAYARDGNQPDIISLGPDKFTIKPISRYDPTHTEVSPLPPASHESAPNIAAMVYELGLKEVGRRAAATAEREAILMALDETHWDKTKAAIRLKVTRRALYYKIVAYGVK